MPVKLGDAFVRLFSDDSDLDKGFAKAEKKTGIFSKGLGEIVTGGLRKVGESVVSGVFGIAQNVIGTLGDSISKASDLNETTSKIEQIFGGASKEVFKFADTADVAFGQTKQQALDAAATFATFGKSAGLAGSDLTKFSTDFVGLASDLASFNNTSPQEAIDAIGAALRGESEPLRKYGVLLDDATLRQKALELGLVKTTKEALTPQQKVLAAQKAIYEQTTAAQGDFARTSGGLANQQRILNAEWENLQTTVGTALLPVMLTLTQTLGSLAAEYLPPLVAFIQSSVVPAMSSFAATLSDLIKQYLPVVKDFISNQLIPAFQSIVGVVTTVITTITGLFSGGGGLNETIGASNGYLTLFSNWFDENLPRIQTIVETVLGAISAFWQQNGDTIMRVVNDTLRIVVEVFDTSLHTILDAVTLVLQLLTGDWAGAAETFQTITSRLWETIGSIVSLALDGLKGTLDIFIGLAVEAWNGLWSTLKNAVTAGTSAVTGAWSELFRLIGEKITNFGGEIYNAGGKLVSSFLDGLQASWGTVESWFSGKLQALRNQLPFSEPKDPSSPLRGLPKSGKAIVEMLQKGLDGADLTIGNAVKNLIPQDALNEAKATLAKLSQDTLASNVIKDTLVKLRQDTLSALGNVDNATKAKVDDILAQASDTTLARLSSQSTTPFTGMSNLAGATAAAGATTNNYSNTINLGGINITVNGNASRADVANGVNDGIQKAAGVLKELRASGVR